MRPRAAAIALALAAIVAAPVQGQGSCTVNFRASCVVGGTAAAGLTVSIPAVVRLQVPSAVVALGTATANDFAAGFGTAVAVPMTIKANRSWTLTFAAGAAAWTGTGPTARPAKPAGDLQWGLSSTGPFTDLATAMSTIGAGAATSGQVIPLHVRTRYSWTADTPGSYSLPLVVTITAP